MRKTARRTIVNEGARGYLQRHVRGSKSGEELNGNLRTRDGDKVKGGRQEYGRRGEVSRGGVY